MIHIATFVIAAAFSAGMILAIFPVLVRYALARPNARSSHKIPTPQGGGIAIVSATLIVVFAQCLWLPIDAHWTNLVALAVAMIALALIGAFDDIRPLPAAPRLLLQVVVVAALLASAGPDARLFPSVVPLWLELTLATIAGVWFVNLVNFMDGLDWITVAEMVPVTGAVALLGAAGFIDPLATLVATALCGALVGFAWFNKPVAQLFLGDVGSLPIGLAVAWLLFMLAGAGYFAAAVILPLYYCADATLTLVRRALRRERLWEAHRSHFYQRATDNGFTAVGVSAHVFVVNLALAVLATWTILQPGPAVELAAVVFGTVIVGWCLRRFTREQAEGRVA
jgi:UDP-N-acetylmuramyl pentapeptide phosphotransferase/UDP-N-acetylglucosamine-1-phosphate transferase